MPEFVRVTDPVSGAEVTVTTQRAKALGLTPSKADATDQYGHALPATPGETKTAATTTSKAAAGGKKES